MSGNDGNALDDLDGGAGLLADRRMNDSEALMWRVEKDPFLASTFGSVSVLDRPVDVERLRHRLAGAVAAVPRLGWRVQPAPSDLGPPVWCDDPDFDLGFHVRHVALPAPGSDEQLYELAAQYVADPLDRTRPLWGFLVVDGLSGGRGALVQRMHHSISDGVTALKLSLQYMDLERDAATPVGGAVTVDGDASPPPAPSPFAGVRSFVEQTFRLPLGIARQVGELLGDPASIPKATTAAADSVRAIATQLSDADAARSPLWTGRSLRRRMAMTTAPFRSVKESSARLGGTINTAFITAVADAAGRYHRERDAPVDELRATMAISTRTAGSGSNAFSLARMLVPTAKMPMRERFATVSEAIAAARQTSSAAGLEVLATLSSALPTTLLTRVVRAQSQTVDLATSNVRGAPMAVYIAGARLLSTAPLGPLAGVAANITMLSYNGQLDVGVHADAAAVDEVERFAELIGRSFASLARLK